MWSQNLGHDDVLTTFRSYSEAGRDYAISYEPARCLIPKLNASFRFTSEGIVGVIEPRKLNFFRFAAMAFRLIGSLRGSKGLA